jgi:hypothetical protein
MQTTRKPNKIEDILPVKEEKMAKRYKSIQDKLLDMKRQGNVKRSLDDYVQNTDLTPTHKYSKAKKLTHKEQIEKILSTRSQSTPPVQGRQLNGIQKAAKETAVSDADIIKEYKNSLRDEIAQLKEDLNAGKMTKNQYDATLAKRTAEIKEGFKKEYPHITDAQLSSKATAPLVSKIKESKSRKKAPKTQSQTAMENSPVAMPAPAKEPTALATTPSSNIQQVAVKPWRQGQLPPQLPAGETGLTEAQMAGVRPMRGGQRPSPSQGPIPQGGIARPALPAATLAEEMQETPASAGRNNAKIRELASAKFEKMKGAQAPRGFKEKLRANKAMQMGFGTDLNKFEPYAFPTPEEMAKMTPRKLARVIKEAKIHGLNLRKTANVFSKTPVGPLAVGAAGFGLAGVQEGMDIYGEQQDRNLMLEGQRSQVGAYDPETEATMQFLQAMGMNTGANSPQQQSPQDMMGMLASSGGLASNEMNVGG